MKYKIADSISSLLSFFCLCCLVLLFIWAFHNTAMNLPPREKTSEELLIESIIKACKDSGGVVIKGYQEGFWSTYETMRCEVK